MSVSWIRSTSRPDTIKIRDDGQEKKAGKFDDKHQILLNEDGSPVELPQPFRPAWPAGTYIRIKSTLTGGDYLKMQELRMPKKPTVKGTASDMENAEVTVEVENNLPALINAAVLVEGLICPAGGVFTDPDTCEKDDEGDPILETGQIMPWPRDIAERMEAAKRLPLQVLTFVSLEVDKRLTGPLPGTQTTTTEGSSSDESGRPSPRKSQKG